jgi:hypothetical protein
MTGCTRWSRAAAGLAAAALLGACSGTKLPDRFHTLLDRDHEGVPPAVAARPFYVDLLPVQVPPQVDHAQWVLRQPDDSLLMLEQDRWAAPLADELRGALVDRLAARWGAIDVRGVAMPVTAAWRVRVDVQRFESISGREARIEGTWSLALAASRERGATTLVCRSAITESVTAPGVAPLAAAHRRAAARLADEIGQRLQALEAGGGASC